MDHRIVWQTCNLLSGIFQSVSNVRVNQQLHTLMIDWALNKHPSKSQSAFIESCLVARKRHQELNNVIIGLFYEVANMGRRKDNSYLIEIFYVLLPQYFFHEYEYLELMDDLLDSHHFQCEKERSDK